MRKMTRGESGSAILETALVLPVLLLVLYSMISFGIAFAQVQALSNAAREGAREGVLFRDKCDKGKVEAGVAEGVNRFANRLGLPKTLNHTISVSDKDLCSSRQVTVTVTFLHRVPGITDALQRVGAL